MAPEIISARPNKVDHISQNAKNLSAITDYDEVPTTTKECNSMQPNQLNVNQRTG